MLISVGVVSSQQSGRRLVQIVQIMVIFLLFCCITERVPTIVGGKTAKINITPITVINYKITSPVDDTPECVQY